MGKEKTEADEADLQEAYDRARSVGLFLVEKYAREALRDCPVVGQLEFVMAMGVYSFHGEAGTYIECEDEHYSQISNHPYSYTPKKWAARLVKFISEWDDVLRLTGEPMRFTADGPVRREW